MNPEEPEELQYFNNQKSIFEILYSLNLYTLDKAEIDYSFLCLRTVDLWLKLNYGPWENTSPKGIAYTFCLRGRRLLRASQILVFSGYLPESEILFRSTWETFLTLTYIMEEPEKRGNKYLSFDYKSGWDLRLLTENMLGKEAYDKYREMSLYVHPFHLGTKKMVYKNTFQVDAIHDFGRAGELLSMIGTTAVAICEVSNKIFGDSEEWVAQHNEIYKTEIFQKYYHKVIELHEQGDTTTQALLDWLEKFQSRDTNTGGVG